MLTVKHTNGSGLPILQAEQKWFMATTHRFGTLRIINDLILLSSTWVPMITILTTMLRVRSIWAATSILLARFTTSIRELRLYWSPCGMDSTKSAIHALLQHYRHLAAQRYRKLCGKAWFDKRLIDELGTSIPSDWRWVYQTCKPFDAIHQAEVWLGVWSHRSGGAGRYALLERWYVSCFRRWLIRALLTQIRRAQLLRPSGDPNHPRKELVKDV